LSISSFFNYFFFLSFCFRGKRGW